METPRAVTKIPGDRLVWSDCTSDRAACGHCCKACRNACQVRLEWTHTAHTLQYGVPRHVRSLTGAQSQDKGIIEPIRSRVLVLKSDLLGRFLRRLLFKLLLRGRPGRLKELGKASPELALERVYWQLELELGLQRLRTPPSGRQSVLRQDYWP